jgi:hypothetical protein
MNNGFKVKHTHTHLNKNKYIRKHAQTKNTEKNHIPPKLFYKERT